jgi:hypothetical protein
VTTRRFLATSLAAAAGVLLIGVAAAAQAPTLGAALALGAAVFAGWAVASYRRKLWAWRIAVTFCFGVFLVTAVLLASVPIAYVLSFEVKGKLLLVVAAGTLVILGGYTLAFWHAMRVLRREKVAFDSASALERTLGRPAW